MKWRISNDFSIFMESEAWNIENDKLEMYLQRTRRGRLKRLGPMALPRSLRQTPHELSPSDWCPLLKMVITRFSPHSTEHQRDIYSMQASQVIEWIFWQSDVLSRIWKGSLSTGWLDDYFPPINPLFIDTFHP